MIALIRTRPPFAPIEHEPYRFLQWIEFFPQHKFIWLTKAPDKILKKFGRENFPQELEFYDMKEYFETDSVAQKTKILDAIIEEKGITEVVTLQNALTTIFNKGKEHLCRGAILKHIGTDNFGNFNVLKTFLNYSYPAWYLTSKLPNQHIYIDPQEGLWHNVHGVDKNKGLWMFYKNDRIGAEYLPFVEWASMKDLNLNLNRKKSDFICGFTVKTSDRVELYNELDRIKSDTINFLVWYPQKKIHTVATRKRYLKLLEETKWTLIIPSYEVVDFSSIRFWESLVRGCVPFVLDSCHWEQAFVEHPEIGKIVGEHLVTSAEDLEAKIKETNHSWIIEQITATSDWKKLQSPDWYREAAIAMGSKFSDTDTPIIKTKSLF